MEMEWVGTNYGRRRRSYTRRPHLYRAGDTRSVCGRSQRLGMNTKVLNDTSAGRLCAICEVIEHTHDGLQTAGPLTSLTDLPEEISALELALAATTAVAFRVVRSGLRDDDDFRIIEVEDGISRAADIAYLVSMVAHDAEGVRFVRTGGPVTRQLPRECVIPAILLTRAPPPAVEAPSLTLCGPVSAHVSNRAITDAWERKAAHRGAQPLSCG